MKKSLTRQGWIMAIGLACFLMGICEGAEPVQEASTSPERITITLFPRYALLSVYTDQIAEKYIATLKEKTILAEKPTALRFCLNMYYGRDKIVIGGWESGSITKVCFKVKQGGRVFPCEAEVKYNAEYSQTKDAPQTFRVAVRVEVSSELSAETFSYGAIFKGFPTYFAVSGVFPAGIDSLIYAGEPSQDPHNLPGEDVEAVHNPPAKSGFFSTNLASTGMGEQSRHFTQDHH